MALNAYIQKHGLKINELDFQPQDRALIKAIPLSSHLYGFSATLNFLVQ